MFRKNADAEAARDIQSMTLNGIFTDDCIHEPLSGNRCILMSFQSRQYKEKLVAAYSGYGCPVHVPCLKFVLQPVAEESHRPHAQVNH